MVEPHQLKLSQRRSPLRQPHASFPIRWLALFMPALIVLSLQALSAQTINTATVRGQVLVQTRSAVEGAEITLTNLQASLKREARSDQGGFDAFAGLPLTGK